MTVKNSEEEQRLARLQQYLLVDPDNATLRADVFDSALACGALDEAQFQVTHALRLQPDQPGWLHRQSLLLIRQGQLTDAEAVLENLIAGGHDDPAIRYNLAYAQFAQGENAKAIASVAPLLHGSDELAQLAWTLWLRCQHHLGQLTDALQAFSDYVASGAGMSADVWGVASLIALDAGRLPDAKNWSERAIKSHADQLEALVARGSVALGEQDDVAAHRLFEHALKISLNDGRSWSGMAFTYMLQKDFAGARTAFNKAVTAMPDHIGTWIGLGWCEFLSNRPDAARSAFAQALALDRNFAESHGALAVALVKLGEQGQAKMELDVALKLDPKSLSARYAQAMLNGEVDDPAKFLSMTKRVLAQHPAPGSTDTSLTLADVVLRHKR